MQVRTIKNKESFFAVCYQHLCLSSLAAGVFWEFMRKGNTTVTSNKLNKNKGSSL